VSQSLTSASFTAAISLMNFDPATRTLTHGAFSIIASDPAAGSAELRFSGADIVNLGGFIQLDGSTARIADLAGSDGLRNLARIKGLGGFTLYRRNFTTAGQFQNDGQLSLYQSVFVVTGAAANFDPAAPTSSITALSSRCRMTARLRIWQAMTDCATSATT
jgi:hypothetical protein